MRIDFPLSPDRTAFALVLTCLLALGISGCDDGRSTWDDLEEHGIEDPQREGAGGLAKSVTESVTGGSEPDAVEVSEVTALGVEASRAAVIVEEVHASLDSLRALENYEGWRASHLGEGPAPLFLGSAESARGVGRLSDEEVAAWADLEWEMLGHVYEDKAACADLAEGNADPSTAINLYNHLSVDQVRRRTRLVLRGLGAELAAEGAQRRAPQRLLGAAFGEALTAVDDAEGPGAGDRFLELIETADKTDAERCELYRLILSHIAAIPPAHRRAILFRVTL